MYSVLDGDEHMSFSKSKDAMTIRRPRGCRILCKCKKMMPFSVEQINAVVKSSTTCFFHNKHAVKSHSGGADRIVELCGYLLDLWAHKVLIYQRLTCTANHNPGSTFH